MFVIFNFYDYTIARFLDSLDYLKVVHEYTDVLDYLSYGDFRVESCKLEEYL